MPATEGSPRRCTGGQTYQVRIQGRLNPRWAAALHGLTLTPEPDGTTTLTGAFPDQAALHGLLGRLRDLGLPLVSIQRLCRGSPEHDSNPAGDGHDEQPA